MMLELEPGYAYKLSRGRWSLPVIVSAEDAAKSKHIGVTMVDGQKMQVFKVGRSTYAQTFGRKRNAAGGRRNRASGHKFKAGDRVKIVAVRPDYATYYKVGQYGFVGGMTDRGGMHLMNRAGENREGETAYIIMKRPGGGGFWFTAEGLAPVRSRSTKSHNHAGTRKPRAEKPADEAAARELELFIENDGRLYEQQWKPILKNLANKKAQGKYDRDKAVKLFMYLMESGAKKYATEVSGEPASWSRTFDVPTRKLAAKSFVENFETQYRGGELDRYLTKVSAKAKASHPNRAGVRRRARR